jgi:hypothetical protein
MTRLEQYNEAWRKAQELMRRVQQSWVRHRDTPKYQVGDQVWLEGRHLRTNQPTAKLAPKRHGPFKVTQVMSPINYRLELPTQWSIHNVFHTDLLTPYREMPTHGANYQHPPPDLVEGVEEYEVEKVLDLRRYGRGHKLQYLVKWVSYPDSDNQWVNWDDAEGAQEVIREFKCSNPNRETHIKASVISSSPTLPTRICSMSTSPSLITNWNFDTPENRAAWDAVTCPSSYFAPAITYGDNNNVDDALTYNNRLRGRRSPGLNSNDLEGMTTLRDVEDTMSSFPDPPPARLSTDSTGGPPILEDSSERLGGRLLIQGICEAGEEKGAARSPDTSKSTGHTPYPNAAILFGSEGEEDNDILCGRCDNPIAYCHCSPVMLPPRIKVDKENNEEAQVSSAKTADDENQPVEVCIGQGGGAEVDIGGGVQAHRRRMYTPGTLQRPARRSLSPTPEGFVRNRGLNYIPFRIPTNNGRGVAPAKWVQLRMGMNPMVWGCAYKGGVVYQGDVHAAPDCDHGPTPDYTNEQLLRVRSDYRLRHEVNEALVQIGDQSLTAEVAQYRNTMDGMQQIQKEIHEKEDKLYCLANTNCKSVGRLAEAHTLAHIAEEEMISNRLMIITPWVMEHGHSS